MSAAVTPRTKAIFLTHLTGQMCDMDAIMAIAEEHDLLVVEDAAHAAGATYKGRFAGSIGDIGCFSFHAIKNMSTLGEGGMLTPARRLRFEDPVAPLDGQPLSGIALMTGRRAPGRTRSTTSTARSRATFV